MAATGSGTRIERLQRFRHQGREALGKTDARK
jgi:hypothetical protein